MAPCRATAPWTNATERQTDAVPGKFFLATPGLTRPAPAHHSLAQLPVNSTVPLGTWGVADVSSVTMSLLTLSSSFSDVSGNADTAEPVTLASDALQPPPPTSAGDTVVPFLEGLAAIEDRMVMVLNLASLTDGAALPEAA